MTIRHWNWKMGRNTLHFGSEICLLHAVPIHPHPSLHPTHPLISGLALPLALMELRARSCDRCISFVVPRLQPESSPSLAITLMHKCRPLLSTALAWRPYINPL
ncbi:uncharacterized [Tachysurus ichikawai]